MNHPVFVCPVSTMSKIVAYSFSALQPPKPKSQSRFMSTISKTINPPQFITSCFKSEKSEKLSSNYEELLGIKEMGMGEMELETERKTELGLNLGRSERVYLRPEKDHGELGLELEELDQRNVGAISERRRGKQLMRRSNLLAKQVISMKTAVSLGFVSQLWVDTLSWVVLVIETRPNLLSGEIERFFLEDISQVGDVLLIQDEGVMEDDFQVSGLETLVGYDVITPGQQNIGKVRGYTFNINSGAVESLELDSFGISIIPSSLVSTYALLIEDVLEVVSDAVVVHEAAVLRMQRLTKGFLGSRKLGSSFDELEEYPDDLEKPPVKIEKGRTKRRTSRQKSGRKKRAYLDDWELPKDFL